MYHYHSPVGTFWIVWREESAEWWLGITSETQSRLLGVYRSAQGAATAVYRHLSGCEQWDCRAPEPHEPKSLTLWSTGPITPRQAEE
ncbi:MAG TPA: hypothetical protein VHP11_08120 [Tepidisphaeraceae bacterium]|nr:hypothetical protein [Tepidisphaeraceae bacterium]